MLEGASCQTEGLHYALHPQFQMIRKCPRLVHGDDTNVWFEDTTAKSVTIRAQRLGQALHDTSSRLFLNMLSTKTTPADNRLPDRLHYAPSDIVYTRLKCMSSAS